MAVSSGNRSKLYIVLDASASMTEGGKIMLMRGIARAVEQYVRFGIADVEIKLISLNSGIKFIEWNPDDEFPDEFFECDGSASFAALPDFLNLASDEKVLLLTDGCWSKEDIESFRLWKSKLPPDTVRLVKIGADYTQLLDSDGVFSTDEFFVALDNWLPVANSAQNNNEEDEW